MRFVRPESARCSWCDNGEDEVTCCHLGVLGNIHLIFSLLKLVVLLLPPGRDCSKSWTFIRVEVESMKSCFCNLNTPAYRSLIFAMILAAEVRVPSLTDLDCVMEDAVF